MSSTGGGGHESCEVDVLSDATALTSDPIMKTSAVLETSDQELSNERSAAEIRQATEEQQRLEGVAELRMDSEQNNQWRGVAVFFFVCAPAATLHFQST